MTPSEIGAYVYDYLDMTVADISAALILRWCQEGQREVRKARPRWVDLETRNTVAIVSGTAQYTIGAQLRSVYAADCLETGPLAFMDEAEAAAAYWRGPSGVRSGRPEALTRWGSGVVKVWPIPNDSYTIYLLGQRPLVVPGSTDDIDVPSDLVDCVVDWVMARAYMQQDDVETAAVHRSLFTAALDRFAADEDRDVDAAPLIFGGGSFQSRRRSEPYGVLLGPSIGDPNWGED